MNIIFILIMFLLSPPCLAEENTDTWPSVNVKYARTYKGKEITKSLNIKEIIEDASEYSYSSYKKDNPFVPPLISSLLAKEEIPIISLLQRHPLISLSVIGIWKLQNGSSKALVLTPNNEGIIVKAGDPIGQKGGTVSNILQDKIIIRNFTIAPDGTREFEDEFLWLGGKPDKQKDSITISSRKLSRSAIFKKAKERIKNKSILRTNMKNSLNNTSQETDIKINAKDKKEEYDEIDLDQNPSEPASAIPQ